MKYVVYGKPAGGQSKGSISSDRWSPRFLGCKVNPALHTKTCDDLLTLPLAEALASNGLESKNPKLPFLS